MGNAVRITNNHIYGNTTGIATDTISAPGHPGFPADSSEIDHNCIYANNLNLYNDPTPPVEPTVGVPIGVGILWAGVNSGTRPRQLHLRQLAPRHDAARHSRPAGQRQRATSTPASPAPTR